MLIHLVQVERKEKLTLFSISPRVGERSAVQIFKIQLIIVPAMLQFYCKTIYPSYITTKNLSKKKRSALSTFTDNIISVS